MQALQVDLGQVDEPMQALQVDSGQVDEPMQALQVLNCSHRFCPLGSLY